MEQNMIEKFMECLTLITSAPERLKPPDLPYKNPRALFFGNGSEMRTQYEVNIETFEFDKELDPLIQGIFLHLASGLDVQLTIIGKSKYPSLKLTHVLDHLYALMTQAFTHDESKVENGIGCGLFHIVLEDGELSSKLEQRTEMIGVGIMNQVRDT